MTDHNTWIGARIAEARHVTGLSQTTVATAMGLQRSSIANIEAGRQRVLAASLIEFGRILDADPRWLLTGDYGAPQPSRRRMSAADADQIRRGTRVLRAIADGLDHLAAPHGPSGAGQDLTAGTS